MMKITRRAVLLLSLLSLTGGTALYAAAGDSEMAVYLNNRLLKLTGIQSGGKMYIPLEQLTDNLHVMQDAGSSNKAIRIYKPNVNLALIDGKGGIFGKVRSGASNTFSVLVQADSLETEITELKITLTDPAGKTSMIDSRKISENDSFWFKSAEYTGSFEVKGSYSIQVFFRPGAENNWAAVAEIQFSTL
ncbi:hypothetical protein [Paenibacillus tengchongensis]|uniref:hypothetical protein n=1 Tax=Paenibacillus tengchongensis TaxID=2608684 RepID=UPI00124ECFF5|nr:hypothetical protein [Paenibacillus tengchongensis]